MKKKNGFDNWKLVIFFKETGVHRNIIVIFVHYDKDERPNPEIEITFTKSITYHVCIN